MLWKIVWGIVKQSRVDSWYYVSGPRNHMFQLSRLLLTESINGDFSTSKNCQTMLYNKDDSEATFNFWVTESKHGLTQHIEANTMKPASIKQNRKKQMWILTMVFLSTPSYGLDMMLCESCSLSFCRRVAVCDSDVEIGFMMRAAYDNNRKVEYPSYIFLVLWRYYQQRNLCLGRLLWEPQKGNSFLHIQTLNLQPQVIQQG